MKLLVMSLEAVFLLPNFYWWDNFLEMLLNYSKRGKDHQATSRSSASSKERAGSTDKCS